MSDIGPIRIRGPYDDNSGYAKLRRELALALDELGIAVQVAPRRDAPTDPPVNALAQRMERLTRPVDARYVIHVDTPDWVSLEPDVTNILYSQLEADRIPPRWADVSLRCDLVIVPCQSAADAWATSGMPRARIRICPQGVRAESFADPRPNPDLLAMGVHGLPLAAYATRFLNLSDLWSGFRENPGGLIGTWIAATTEDDDAVLVLKWFDYRGSVFVQDFLARVITNVEQALGKPAHRAAPIRLLARWYPDDELAGMYAAFTHYLSVSSGEGWDLAMTEAGAAGLRLIAPDHTGYRAYLNESLATLVPTKLVPVDVGGWNAWAEATFTGARWWEPDLDATAAAIRDAIDGRDRYKPRAAETILREFSWTKAAAQLIRILEHFERERCSNRDHATDRHV